MLHKQVAKPGLLGVQSANERFNRMDQNAPPPHFGGPGGLGGPGRPGGPGGPMGPGPMGSGPMGPGPMGPGPMGPGGPNGAWWTR